MYLKKKQAIENICTHGPWAVISTPYWIDNEVPFESLPPEIMAKIIKMAMKSGFASDKHQYNFLGDVVSKVSKKFQNVASIKSLWAGDVFLWGGEAKIWKVINNYLNDLVSGLELEGELERRCSDVTLSTFDLYDILLQLSAKCPNLTMLTISNYILKGPWPTLPAHLTSLKRLEIREGPVVSDIFVGAQIHRDLPNLEDFAWVCSGPRFRPQPRRVKKWYWSRKIVLAQMMDQRCLDLSKCENLRTVRLCHEMVQRVHTGVAFPRAPDSKHDKHRRVMLGHCPMFRAHRSKKHAYWAYRYTTTKILIWYTKYFDQ